MAVQENGLAYLTVGARLVIVDLTDPHWPRVVGQSAVLPGSGLTDVAVVDGIAYVLTGNQGLQLLDVTDVTNIKVVGHLVYDSEFLLFSQQEVAVHNQHAYIAVQDKGVLIVDVSQASKPQLVTMLPLAGTTRPEGFSSPIPKEVMDIEIFGSFLYVANGFGGLQVWDVSQPKEPVQTAGYQPPGEAYGLAIEGEYLYLSYYFETMMMPQPDEESTTGLHILDISVPTQPTLIHFEPLQQMTNQVTAVNNTLFASTYEGFMQIDVSQVTAPVIAAEYRTTAVESMTAAGNRAYVVTLGGEVQIVDMSTATTPISYQAPGTYAFNSIVVADNVAYVTGEELLTTFDLSDPTNPQPKGEYRHSSQLFPSLGRLEKVIVRDQIAYVANASNGLFIFDVADLTQPQLLWEMKLSDATMNLTLHEDLLYVSDQDGGLHVFDVSEPAAASLIHRQMDLVWDTAVLDHYLYILKRDGNEQIVIEVQDISNPAVPITLQTVPIAGYYTDIGDMLIHDDALWVTVEVGLQRYDLSDPANPQHSSIAADPHPALLAFSAESVYGLDWEGYVHRYAWQTAEALLAENSFMLPGRGRDITIANNVVFVVGDSGLFIFRR